ncbi:MAG: acetyl-CoA hydrolase/transferase C-terminal domain-containing protein, partial [Pseudomonadota bacterium]
MQKMSAPEALSSLRERLSGPGRIYVPGCSGEPQLFVDAMKADPALAADLTFLGVWIPGVNRTDYAGLHPAARSELIFSSADFHESILSQRAKFRPLSYTQAVSWLESTPLDAAIVQVSEPDEKGICTLGVSADFTPILFDRNVFTIAHINPNMPAPATSPRIAIDQIDICVEAQKDILAYETRALPPVFEAIAANIGSLINDAETLQFGLGNVQQAVLQALVKKKNLRIHSGMVSDPVQNAIDAGAIARDPGSITTGVALGTKQLYDRASCDARFRFAPVSFTHAIDTLSTIENFTAINSVIEVDLFGQANAEFLSGKQISGAGGLVDFLRGAAIAPGGKPIVALASTAKGGAVSRIVPKIEAPCVSVSRADMAIVATEHGVADLRGKTVEER